MASRATARTPCSSPTRWPRVAFATIAIDLPLHGVTPSSAAYAQAFATPFERTFDLDLQINAQFGVPGTGRPGRSHRRQFPQPRPTCWSQRDNSRQAIVDIIALVRTIPVMDFDGIAGADFDPARIHVIGYSLGGTHAGTVLGLLGAEVKASALPSAAALLDGDDQGLRDLWADHRRPAGREGRAAEHRAVSQLLPQRAGGIRRRRHGELCVDDVRRRGGRPGALFLDLRRRCWRISHRSRSSGRRQRNA